MLFMDALKLLKDGKYIARSSWKEEDGYLVLMKNMKYVWKILFHPTPNAGNHSFSVEELLADDWEEFQNKTIIDEKKKIEIPDTQY